MSNDFTGAFQGRFVTAFVLSQDLMRAVKCARERTLDLAGLSEFIVEFVM